MLLCGLVPLVMWRKGAIGGGDVKLFAALGALTLPRFGFEAELYVFVVAAFLGPMELIYRGKMLQVLGNIGAQFANLFRKKENRRPLDPALTGWFRLGPCFAIGFAVQVLFHCRSPW
jgi:prepilin peptidase CpaA